MHTIKMIYRQALVNVMRAVNNGASPEHVADMILRLPYEILPSVSRTIEGAAHPGSFAEAVYDILDAKYV